MKFQCDDTLYLNLYNLFVTIQILGIFIDNSASIFLLAQGKTIKYHKYNHQFSTR